MELSVANTERARSPACRVVRAVPVAEPLARTPQVRRRARDGMSRNTSPVKIHAKGPRTGHPQRTRSNSRCSPGGELLGLRHREVEVHRRYVGLIDTVVSDADHESRVRPKVRPKRSGTGGGGRDRVGCAGRKAADQVAHGGPGGMSGTRVEGAHNPEVAGSNPAPATVVMSQDITDGRTQ